MSPQELESSGRYGSEVARHPSSDTLRSRTDSEITAVNGSTELPSSSDITAVNSRENYGINFANVDLSSDVLDIPPIKHEDINPSDEPPPYRYTLPAGTYSPPTAYKYEKLSQKNPGLMDHPSITFGGPMIALFDIVVPCIIYYTWYNSQMSKWDKKCSSYKSDNEACPYPHPEFDKHVLGLAIISFGIGELYILLARVWRLYMHREECAPLLSRARWELDATSWVYLVAMMCALIPFVVGSTMVLPKLYLYSPAFLMSFLGLLMIATLLPIPLPIGINSHARGSVCRPFIYYAAEDFIAVDGLQGRDFRVRYNARYENSPAFRRLFVLLTIWWIIGVVVYIVCLSAVIWTIEFHHAFGLSLGILFAYIATWAGTSYLFVAVENKLEYNRAKETGTLHEDYIR